MKKKMKIIHLLFQKIIYISSRSMYLFKRLFLNDSIDQNMWQINVTHQIYLMEMYQQLLQEIVIHSMQQLMN